MENVMLDIETLGTSPNSAILQIAVQRFDINSGELGDSANVFVSAQSCIRVGLEMEFETISWWMKQENTTIFDREGMPLHVALNSLNGFIKPDDLVWANSPSFDCRILRNAYAKTEIEVPWKYKNEWCFRTMMALYPEIKENHVYSGMSNDALDDCRNQIEMLVKCFKKINNESNTR